MISCADAAVLLSFSTPLSVDIVRKGWNLTYSEWRGYVLNVLGIIWPHFFGSVLLCQSRAKKAASNQVR